MAFRHEKKKVFDMFGEFLREVRKHLPKLYIFLVIVLSLWIIFQVLYLWNGFNILDWIHDHPYVRAFSDYMDSLLVNKNYFRIFVFYLLAAIFIFPAPLEIMYITFLSYDFPFPRLYVSVIAGILIAQHINFFLGKYFGKHIHPHLDKKTVEKFETWVEKYGSYAIFLINLTPLPYALLNFVVGMGQFEYRKWVLLAVPAIMLNYLLQYLFFALVLN